MAGLCMHRMHASTAQLLTTARTLVFGSRIVQQLSAYNTNHAPHNKHQPYARNPQHYCPQTIKHPQVRSQPLAPPLTPPGCERHGQGILGPPAREEAGAAQEHAAGDLADLADLADLRWPGGFLRVSGRIGFVRSDYTSRATVNCHVMRCDDAWDAKNKNTTTSSKLLTFVSCSWLTEHSVCSLPAAPLVPHTCPPSLRHQVLSSIFLLPLAAPSLRCTPFPPS